MTLREWLDVYTRDGDAQLVCAWRKRVWRVMRPVVALFVAELDAGCTHSAGELLAAIEDAREVFDINPIGKRWRQEHLKLVGTLQGQRQLWPAIEQDEADVCAVARDLEEEGRTREAQALVDEQAPNRLNRKCPACGAKPGDVCIGIVAGVSNGLIAPHDARVVAP